MISTKYRRMAALLMAVVLSLTLGGCGGKETGRGIAVLENREGEYVFSLSVHDFIESYNALYRRDNQSDYLRPLPQWSKDTLDTAIHSQHETICYTFAEEKNKWLLPTISVYVPTDTDTIQEIMLSFDDHGYTAEMYALYEQLCFYTVKVFLPTLTDEQIVELYTTLNDLAYEHFTNEKYTSASVPCALYHKDGIGLYPYFANGECVHLCVIPVTDGYLGELEAGGTEIHEMI